VRFISRWLFLLCLGCYLPVLQAQIPGRLVDVIDIDEHDNSQVDITLQFTCSLHYSGHTPASEGPELRVRLRPDRTCGAAGAELADEIPPISGPRGILSSAHVETSLGTEVTLTLTFARPESFVLAQGASPTGMRIRLIRARVDKPRILVTDRGDTANNFAVNLESQHQPFDPDTIRQAGERLQTKTFVSEIDAGGEKWYRLRAGPFDQRSVAESVLRAASKDYPQAWLAVGDDSITTDPNAAVPEPPLPPVEPMGADPALAPEERVKLLDEARKALRGHHYPEAIQLLTKLQRQPEFPQRSEAQELLGLARERSGEIAQAKAEYEEYLRRYPKGPAAERVRTRLRILRSATSNRGGGFGTSADPRQGWNISGGVTQLYRRDTFSYSGAGSKVVENAIFSDTDFYARRVGERVDFSFRFNGGMEENFVSHHNVPVGEPNPDDRVHITTAVFDLSDKLSGLRARIGRQTSTSDGIFGTFDGAVLQYSVVPAWTVRVSAGSPVFNADNNLDTHRRFESLALNYGPQLGHFNSSVYVIEQTEDGNKDRQALGAQWQYFAPGRSLVSYVDYDFHNQSLNSAVLLGTVQLPGRWQLTADAERHNTFDTLDQLSTYGLSALKQLGERYQVMFDFFVNRESAANVIDSTSTAIITDLSYQIQFFGTGLVGAADFHQLAFRYEHSDLANTAGVDYIARYPLFGAWRIGPRILIQRRVNSDESIQYLYNPYAHADWQRNGRTVEIEAGTEIGHNPQLANTQRLFVSVGYRVNF
jgi:hypothetical protein